MEMERDPRIVEMDSFQLTMVEEVVFLTISGQLERDGTKTKDVFALSQTEALLRLSENLLQLALHRQDAGDYTQLLSEVRELPNDFLSRRN